jgi:hypothetical protein
MQTFSDSLNRKKIMVKKIISATKKSIRLIRLLHFEKAGTAPERISIIAKMSQYKVILSFSFLYTYEKNVMKKSNSPTATIDNLIIADVIIS